MNREEFIKENLIRHKEELEKRGYKWMYIALQGSQNYGMDIYTDSYKSDVDTKAIILPSLEDIVLDKSAESYTAILDNKEHIDIKDVRQMFRMFRKQNIAYLELLFTDYYLVNPKYEKYVIQLRDMAENIVAMHPISFYNSIKGMALQKLKALKHPYPNIMDKINEYGYDPKQLHHIIRLYYFLCDYEKTGSFKQALVPSTEKKKGHLLRAKLHGYNLESAEEQASDFCKKIKAIADVMCDEQLELLEKDPEIKATDKELNDMLMDIIVDSLKEDLNED